MCFKCFQGSARPSEPSVTVPGLKDCGSDVSVAKGSDRSNPVSTAAAEPGPPTAKPGPPTAEPAPATASATEPDPTAASGAKPGPTTASSSAEPGPSTASTAKPLSSSSQSSQVQWPAPAVVAVRPPGHAQAPNRGATVNGHNLTRDEVFLSLEQMSRAQEQLSGSTSVKSGDGPSHESKGHASPLLMSWVSDMAKEMAVFQSNQGQQRENAGARVSPLLAADYTLLQDLSLLQELGGSPGCVTYDGLWQSNVRVAVKVLCTPARGHQQANRVELESALRAVGVHASDVKSSNAGLTTRTSGTQLSKSSLPSAALAEALLSKNLSHPNVVRTYAVRCARLSLPFVAASQFVLCPTTEELRAQLQLYLACLSEDVLACSRGLQEATDVDRLVKEVQDFKLHWQGSTALAGQRGGSGVSTGLSFMSQESTPSQDGFGDPSDRRRPLSWQRILSNVGAGPGDFITVIIMRFCDMGTLDNAITSGIFSVSRGNDLTSQNRRKRFRALLRTAREVAQGVEHLHACDIIHGNLKPSNVLLCGSRADIRGFSVHVADFGVSRMVQHAPASAHAGALEYTAPEVMLGKDLSPACDIYALGIMMWAMTSVLEPYQQLDKETLINCVAKQELRPEWPSNEYDSLLKTLYYQCVAPEPEKRPTAKLLVSLLATLEVNVRNGMIWRPQLVIPRGLMVSDSSARQSDQKVSPLSLRSGASPVQDGADDAHVEPS